MKENHDIDLNKDLIMFRYDLQDSDGLEEIKNLLINDYNQKHKPKVLEDMDNFFDENDIEGSIGRLCKNSDAFKKYQDELVDLQKKNDQAALNYQKLELELNG